MGGGTTSDTATQDTRNVRVCTINVTSLNRARLESILMDPSLANAHVLALQEIRHAELRPRWMRSLALSLGWHFAASHTPGLDSMGRTAYGGTALLWKVGLSNAQIYRHGESHREIALKLPNLVVASLYGPAGSADTVWLDSVMEWLSSFNCNTIALGDFNWRPAYDHHLPFGWKALGPCWTTTADTAPTRLVSGSFGAQPLHASCVDVHFIAGIPYHGLVSYEADYLPRFVAPSRLRSTAAYDWTAREVLPPNHALLEEVDESAPKLSADSSLLQRWTRWHLRAETLFSHGTHFGFCTLLRKAERPKGSPPTVRPTTPAAPHRDDEPVSLRRLKRLHRRFADRLRSGSSANDVLVAKDVRSWQAAVDDGILRDCFRVPSIGVALDSVSAAVAREEACLAKSRSKQWKTSFKTWGQHVWKPAKYIMRPQFLKPSFTADEMAADWSKTWSPPDYDGAKFVQAWLAKAEGVDFPTSSESADWLPSYAQFLSSILDAHGNPGFDGWTASELKGIARFVPSLLEELYELWLETSRSDDVPQGVCDHLWSWRVAGLPKKSEDVSRPISVGGIATRAWHASLSKCFPQPHESQWCCRKQTSVVHATSHWLAEPMTAGAELDLTKAYDLLDHDLVCEALLKQGISRFVVQTLRRAWKGLRICHVHGDLSVPITPLRGIPQGCSCAPGSMISTLVPWDPGCKHWAYMDDRSLAADGQDSVARIDDALLATTAFDSAVGNQENASKRQRWNATTHDRVEHLGLSVVPSLPSAEIRPRDGWGKIDDLIARVASVPGSAKVREIIASAFVRPHFVWAAPLQWPAPTTCVKALFQAVVRTKCTWWCQGRWWALHAQLHPLHSAAWQTLKAITHPNLVWSAHVEESLRRHLVCLGLSFVRYCPDNGVLLKASSDDDPRVLQLVRSLDIHRQSLRFWAHSDHAQHVVRVISRIRCLMLAQTSRLDSEGISDVDIDASSHASWINWLRSLSNHRTFLLNIWRCGAISTPTRRQSSVPCSFCGFAFPSARHYWVECSRFDTTRQALTTEFNLPASFWTDQPRVTSKSGWITQRAADSLARRAQLQVASCRLALVVMETLGFPSHA